MITVKAVSAVILLASLGGCMAAAKTGAKHILAEETKTPEERITRAQESALDAAHGGSAEAPVEWSDKVSGLSGRLTVESRTGLPENCRQYRDVVSLAGQMLEGHAIACIQQDGSWKLFKPPE